MKAPIRIGLPPGLRVLYIERYPAEVGTVHIKNKQIDHVSGNWSQGYWLLPIHTNPNRTLGTFMRFYDNGKIEQITIRENEGDEIILIKPEDK